MVDKDPVYLKTQYPFLMVVVIIYWCFGMINDLKIQGVPPSRG